MPSQHSLHDMYDKICETIIFTLAKIHESVIEARFPLATDRAKEKMQCNLLSLVQNKNVDML